MSLKANIFAYKLHYLIAIVGCLLAYYRFGLNYATLRDSFSSAQSNKNGLFTKDELARYDGGPDSRGLYISILGTVFDVKKGEQHYGPGGSYHVFAAKDASKAFITGDFETSTEEELEDVLTLTGRDLLGLKNWRDFYEKTYVFKGYLMGRFYLENGEKTEYHKLVDAMIDEALDNKDKEKVEQQNYPPCNVEWNVELGTRVWCTAKSGGISRDWVGVPRQYYKEGSKDPVCVCAQIENLDLPSFRPYKNCDKLSESCYAKDEEL